MVSYDFNLHLGWAVEKYRVGGNMVGNEALKIQRTISDQLQGLPRVDISRARSGRYYFVMTMLIAIAGIVTPLGLYEDNALGEDTQVAEFAYVRDSSHFFAGTSLSDELPFTRKCMYHGDRSGYAAPGPCPYTNDTMIWETNGLTWNASSPEGVNMTVPNIVKDIYSSGTKLLTTTVSNFFDIHWRQVTTRYDEDAGPNGSRVAVGQFNMLESFVLDDAYRVVEGLVVNAKTGGIGFRNHTIPVGLPRGATWFEDLLFIEPEVECADMNITIDYGVSTSAGGAGLTGVTNLRLTDRGGFTNFNTTVQANDTLNESNTPNLKLRAHTAAWMLTAYSMFLLNASNPRRGDIGAFKYIDSQIGKEFKLPVPEGPVTPLLNLGMYDKLGAPFGFSTSIGQDEFYKNPWNVTVSEFNGIREICQGTWAYDRAALNTTFVDCNLMRGTPRRVDRPGVIFQDGSEWSSPLYTCASSVKATIKRVQFFHNGTNTNLENLVVQEIKDKQYESEADMPLWGVEDWFYKLDDYNPVWGLVNAAYEGFRNVTTVRSSSFYMLGAAMSSGGFVSDALLMNLPAGIAPLAALSTVMSSGSSTSDRYDLVGANKLSTWLRWQNISGSAETIPNVIKLMWTDLAASAMVGGKGVLGAGNAQPDQAVTMRVRPTIRKVKYRYRFGIPAFLVGLFVFMCSLFAFGSLVFGQSSVGIVSQRLKQTSVGRALTTAFYPEASSFGMTPNEWVAVHGSKKLDLAGYAAPASEAPPLPFRPGYSGYSGQSHGVTDKFGSQYSAVPMSSPNGYQ
ncbi:hypothetical protein HJFPF1_05980 [Paramyrothecium foliicola]|nr:hypothetical protein HJFPF1_05980 [Paramyrothecium foliicola]